MSSVIPGFQGLPAFAQVYNLTGGDVNVGATFTFDSNGILNGFSHTVGSDTITSQVDGVFCVIWIINGGSGGAFTFLQNNNPIVPMSYVNYEPNQGQQAQGLIVISKNDTFKLRNDTPFVMTTPSQAGYTNSSIIFMQIGNHG